MPPSLSESEERHSSGLDLLTERTWLDAHIVLMEVYSKYHIFVTIQHVMTLILKKEAGRSASLLLLNLINLPFRKLSTRNTYLLTGDKLKLESKYKIFHKQE